MVTKTHLHVQTIIKICADNSTYQFLVIFYFISLDYYNTFTFITTLNLKRLPSKKVRSTPTCVIINSLTQSCFYQLSPLPHQSTLMAATIHTSIYNSASVCSLRKKIYSHYTLILAITKARFTLLPSLQTRDRSIITFIVTYAYKESYKTKSNPKHYYNLKNSSSFWSASTDGSANNEDKEEEDIFI